MGGVSYNWIGTDRFKVKSETERFTVVCPRCRQNLKEARNSFPFFQSNKHIQSLDTVRVIILRRNLARVLSTHRRFLTLYFPPK